MWTLGPTVLSLVNLALLLGVIRRLDTLRQQGAPEESPLPRPGTKIGATAVPGLTGRTLVAFFAEHCTVCADLVPAFAAFARDFPGDHVLVVAVQQNGDTRRYAELTDLARVVVEPPGGPVAAAFGVDGFPTFLLLADNVVLAAASKVELLR